MSNREKWLHWALCLIMLFACYLAGSGLLDLYNEHRARQRSPAIRLQAAKIARGIIRCSQDRPLPPSSNSRDLEDDVFRCAGIESWEAGDLVVYWKRKGENSGSISVSEGPIHPKVVVELQCEDRGKCRAWESSYTSPTGQETVIHD